MGVLVLLVLQILAGINLSLCSEENSTATQFMATSSSIVQPNPPITTNCPVLSPTTAAFDDGTFLSIPQSYLPIIVIVLFFATVILCCTSLILTMGLFILCCRTHNRYSPPNITAPMIKSDDHLWKAIPKPLTEALAEDEDGKYLEVNEITMNTFRKNHAIITPSHNATTPLITKGDNRSNDSEITLPLHAKPYPTPTIPNNQEGLPSTFTGQSARNSRQHALAEASTSAPIDIGSPAEKPSLPRSTSDGSMYMKMESCSAVLQGKPYLPEAESLELVSYVDYILPANNIKEDEYENASALRLANAQKNNSVQPPTPNQAQPADDKRPSNFKRPPEPKPKPNKLKPRKMNSTGLINPVLLPAANEGLHYSSPHSAGLTSDGYKEIESTTFETSDYAIPVRGNSLPGHADAQQRPKPLY